MEPNTKRVMKKPKTENRVLRRNGPVIKYMKSVLRTKDSLWWERVVKEVGLEPRVKERRCYPLGNTVKRNSSIFSLSLLAQHLIPTPSP